MESLIRLSPAGPRGDADTLAFADRTLLRTGERGPLTVTTDGQQV